MSLDSSGNVQPTTGYETYIESWNGTQKAEDILNTIPITSDTVIDIAFSDYNISIDSQGNVTNIGGLQLWSSTSQTELQQLQELVDKIHAKGGKVKISFGGATYSLHSLLPPGATASDIRQIADNIAKVVKQFRSLSRL